MPARLPIILLLAGIGLISLADRAAAHFQVLLPSTDIVEDQDTRTVDLDLRFTHPMEQGPTMNMARPRQVAALVGGKRIDLAGRLKPRKVDGKSAFTCSLPTTTPGDYVVYVEPEPYWEAAEAEDDRPLHESRDRRSRRGKRLGCLGRPARGNRAARAALWSLDGQHLPRHRKISRQARAELPAWKSSTSTRAGG